MGLEDDFLLADADDETSDGRSLLQDMKQDTDQLVKLLEKGQIKTIHSMEPTLETVFISLTGKELI